MLFRNRLVLPVNLKSELAVVIRKEKALSGSTTRGVPLFSFRAESMLSLGPFKQHYQHTDDLRNTGTVDK